MPKKTKPSQSDINTFQEAIKGVKPLIYNKIRLTKPTNLHKPTCSHPATQKEFFHLSESTYLPFVRGDEFISYKQPGVPNKTLRKLQKGQYNVDIILDLHGMTVAEARITVDNFIQQCLHDQIRVGLIIHGKGLHSQMPILKNKLNHWLRETKVILAFCSATARHGNQGAVYLLFRCHPEENKV